MIEIIIIVKNRPTLHYIILLSKRINLLTERAGLRRQIQEREGNITHRLCQAFHRYFTDIVQNATQLK